VQKTKSRKLKSFKFRAAKTFQNQINQVLHKHQPKTKLLKRVMGMQCRTSQIVPSSIYLYLLTLESVVKHQHLH